MRTLKTTVSTVMLSTTLTAMLACLSMARADPVFQSAAMVNGLVATSGTSIDMVARQQPMPWLEGSILELVLTAPPPIGDCDDTNPNVYPGAVEIVGNDIDDNCNGLADEANDGSPSTDMNDNDADGFSLNAGDCNDLNPSIYPGAEEIIGDYVDNNCNGLADEDAQGNPSTDTVDHDGDGLPMSDDRLFYGGFDP